MSEAFVDVGMSLDGFIAGPNGRPGNPLGDGGTRIHQWLYPLATFHQRMGLSGGKTGPDDEILQGVFARTGSYVMGRRMFDEGEVGAEAAAGGKDVRVSGGANLIQQYLQARLVDELTIHVAPVVLGQGVRLFDQATLADGTLQPTKVVGSPSVTHLTFRVVKDGAAG